jgi:restriction system protein
MDAVFTGGLLLTFLFTYKRYKKGNKHINLQTCNNVRKILDVYKNNPTGFEHFVASIYEKQGYKVHVTKATGDCGKDIIMQYGKIKYVVECKLYNHNNVIGRPLVQKLHSAAIDEKAIGIFVTTSSFTLSALQYANKNGIVLVSGHDLEKMIRKTVTNVTTPSIMHL